MTNETVTKSKRFYCVSLTPDICKTPVGSSKPPLPYTIVGEFSDATNVSPNVRSHSEPVILHQRSIIPTVKGDAAGSAGGVKSGTVGKQVNTKAFSATHHANGTGLLQVGREVWMNARNTVGKIYERGGETARPLLATLNSAVDKGLAGAQESLKSAAQEYQDNYSAPLHDTGTRLMDAGGKTMGGGAALVGTGAAASATGVGAVAGAPMMAVGAAVTTVGGAATTGGAIVDTSATVLDHASKYVLTGKTPDFANAAMTMATGVVEAIALNKLGPVGRWLQSKTRAFGGKATTIPAAGKKPGTPAPPPSKPPSGHDDDGKSRGRKGPKSEPPSECCPKNKAPANKRVKSKKPVHFGTGQEILHQTDFATAGTIPIEWTRCYRSGAETEDWGLLGARWSSAFTTSVSLTPQGCVYHDESGRALRLPHLAPGQAHDDRKEGFFLVREDADSFVLTWRDGSRDRFERGADGYLPHGYDGVNPMLEAGAPVRAARFVLTRSAARDGSGISIEVWPEALPGALLLRISADDGAVLEAMREDLAGLVDGGSGGSPSEMDAPDPQGRPRIGRVEEVLEDGTRVCHVRYRYAPDSGDAPVPKAADGVRPETPFPGRSCNLISQTNALGDARSYTYQHHLLTACTSYTGFKEVVEWVSLAALRERWSGSTLDGAALAAEYPITRDTSYQARAIASRAADGSEGAGVALTYLDNDTTRVSENGDVLDYTFDRNWLVTCVSRVTDGVARPLGRREWSSEGLLLADSDALGRTARYTYDGAGNLTSSTDAGGHTAHIAYDGDNQPVSLTDPMGHTSRRSYDGAGRLASVTDALGHVTSYRYDDKGRLVEQVDAKGGAKRFDYDRGGRLRTFTDCSGCATKYRYDERGRLAAVIDAEAAPGQQTRYTYDALGRVVTLTRPDGSAENYAYDADGNLLAHTDAMGHQTRYRYSGQGLLIERTDAIGQTVRYRYDTALRLVELANAKDERYLLAYDADGALTAETGFDGKTTNYVYDKAGQLTASECAGQRTELVRDARGLLVAKMNADGMVRYAYDELGRMIAVAAPQAEQRFAYDALGQLVEERAAYFLVSGPVAPPVDGSRVADAGFVMTHAYDELGNRIRTTLPNGRRVDTLRYGSGHWHGTLWQGVAIVDVERDKLHRERKRQIGRGSAAQRMVATRAYDPQSRLSAMTLMQSSGGMQARPLRERRFGYDAAGNLLYIDHGGDTHGGSPATFTYTYDPVGQLLSATQPGLTEQFMFDPAGNLLDPASQTATPQRTGSPALPADVAQLPAVTANLLRTYLGHSYTYDAQGNVTAKRFVSEHSATAGYELALEYDADNRLRRSKRTCHLARSSGEYFYDAFSRRIAKRVVEERWRDTQQPERDAPDRVSESTTLFVWDGDVLAQELSASDTVTYLYEPDSFVAMARVGSRGGYGNLGREHGTTSGQGNVRQAQKGRDGAISAALGAAKWLHLWCVKQWMPHGQPQAARRQLLEDANDPAEEVHRAAWNQRQVDAQAASSGDCVDYYNCDHLGTPRELLDETGCIVWTSRTSVWGRTFGNSNFGEPAGGREGIQSLRFQGQYEDAETGFFFNRYRYYDPDNARYVTQDPIRLAGGLNLYGYPIVTSLVDPLGLVSLRPTDPPSASLTDLETRCWYTEQESMIPCMLNRGVSLKQQARQALTLRNEARIRARLLMLDREKAIGLYTGSTLGVPQPMLTWRGMLAKHAKKGLVGARAYEAIIESSQRSRASVNSSVIGDAKCDDVLASITRKYGCR